MQLSELTELCRGLETTRSRLEKTRLAASALQRASPGEVPWMVAFLTGRPFPASDPRVLDVSWVTLAELMGALPPAPAAATLDLADVARAFEATAGARGPGSRRMRLDELSRLFARATEAERDILRRVVHGEMRLGLHEGLLPEVIAEAAGLAPTLVRRAMLLMADPAEVARLALSAGEVGLRGIGVRLLVPLLPMLADPAPDVDTTLAAHGGRTALEWKYDGARVQIHKDGDTVRIWSRRLTEITESLPEVVDLVRRDLDAGTCILDGEVVAVGPGGRPLPFQDLMRRLRRVHGVEASARDVPLALFLFDCLLVDGRLLVDEPCAARWAVLERLTAGRLLARRIVATDAEAARRFLDEALGAGHEGLIAKALDSPYTPGTRGTGWLKVKLVETIDCVIVAADRGSGRRRGWLSNYHLAVREDSGGLAPVGKTFKGLTDREFAEMTARLQALAISDDGYTITVRPEVVVEVAYNEIQRSPRYSSGHALRFARIARVRDDKGPEQATTLAELRARYARQFAAKARLGPA